MILDVYRCDRCGEEAEPIEPDEYTDFVEVIVPCVEHGRHRFQYCGLECAMHACAHHLDHEEAVHEEAPGEADG
jgi:hypothetical protein